MTISDKLKQKIVKLIVEDFLSTEDVADALMGLATDLTEEVVNPNSQDLFSEVSGMVAYKLGGIMLTGFAQDRKSAVVETSNIPKSFNLGAALDVLDGNFLRLYHAFSFDHTSQGYDYWDNRASGNHPLLQSDLDCIREWVEIAQNAEKGE
jgi:hypothetical protein